MAKGSSDTQGADGTSSFLRDLGTIPNLVSLARIVFVYVAIWLFFIGEFRVGIVIGVLAGLSDYLDGYLARRLNMSTRVGALLDQAADLLFISGCILIFVMDGTWPVALILVVLFREVVVMNLRASAAEMQFGLPSIFLGKWASNWMFWSLAVMGAARGTLFGPFNEYAIWVSHFAMVVGVVSSLITGAVYLRSYMRQYVAKPSAVGAALLHVADRGGDERADGGRGDDR